MTRDFKLRDDDPYIQLIQLLKVMNIAESGAIASEMVLSSQVKVNGVVDNRKRKKLVKGDSVQVYSEIINIV
jgi:Uncharacterized conserved protein